MTSQGNNNKDHFEISELNTGGIGDLSVRLQRLFIPKAHFILFLALVRWSDDPGVIIHCGEGGCGG